ncbi:alpha/beta hydrolase family protein [Gluconacetobacter tumulisoli]|uniref:Alpha/beta hydrolase n=1 Tax=Gluconacetobacter tumulisoli TaxID=1286189 RepID=A0A7W4K7K7_9PROT|nr:alpha/beta hydrolase [Gluconacetobacter tumulisoli]MBB2201720.1 alpha/beta hydrolase [Gluconacetobacter tumulisoli]
MIESNLSTLAESVVLTSFLSTKLASRPRRDSAKRPWRPLVQAILNAAICGFGLLASHPAFADSAINCHIGSYRLASGAALDIAPSEGDTLRWRLFNGETGQLLQQADGTWKSTSGWTGRPDEKIVSFSDCDKGDVRFDADVGHRIAFDVTDTKFLSNGVTLVGRLVMPKSRDKVPVVVLVHGSEHTSALDFYSLQRMFPAQGIGAFVYDKRGTGASGGAYTQNFETLADDAVLAMREARRLGGVRVGRIGYQGGSEGGWVAPLAAEKAPVDFTIVSFGLAVTILQEDQESVALDMHFHHHEADTPKALELASAGEHVLETNGKEGYEAFEALRQKYKTEPWYKDVHGDFIFFILPLDKTEIEQAAKQFGAEPPPFRYEPMPVLSRSTTPQLWVLGGDDLDAPSAETGRRIKSLIAAGKPYTLAVYPGAEHGMTEYELNANGERVSTRYAPGYFQMMADFTRNGRIGARYGEAEITQPLTRSGTH